MLRLHAQGLTHRSIVSGLKGAFKGSSIQEYGRPCGLPRLFSSIQSFRRCEASVRSYCFFGGAFFAGVLPVGVFLPVTALWVAAALCGLSRFRASSALNGN